ncbi:hypothetical protein [Pelistega sp. MC2]|uniref:hypothetical protein n=1 Tax=Pelistega sp. MC2 TaxID=1720297 RepID=UPI0015A3F415|nr:hypothetical protein [Pelistega sp. MC2]
MEVINVIKFLLSLILLNVILYGLGANWFGFTPSETKITQNNRLPIEYRPQNIQLIKDK